MPTIASRFLRYIPGNLMLGPDVREVQERLHRVGFYQGEVDGVYGTGTAAAVSTFQSAHGLVPDGIVGPDTYRALGTEAAPAPPPGSPSIVIDVVQRRLYFKRGSAVERVYDVAVGAPATPTPVGRWSVVQKVMNPGGPFGTRWMRLSIPWGSYGIHGTNDPSSIGRAVSHGCVRMQNRDVEELYAMTPVGTVVEIVGQTTTGRVLVPTRAAGPDVRALQDELRVLGYYTGASDGIYGPQTAAAVAEFQRQHGLAPSGVMTPETYDALQRTFDMARGSTAP